jgi:hypothetical protein
MLERFLRASKRIQGPLLFHIRTFATSLVEDGYLEAAAESKLWCLAELGRWMKRKGLTVATLNEPRVEAFVRRYQQVGRGDPKTLKQFRDHLPKRGVIPGQKLACDRSPLAEILGRYEKHLRSERGLVVVTILNYQSFVRNFLVECFREGPFQFAEMKPSGISGFVLRHGPSMRPRRAQLMTTAFRSFFRFLFQHGELKADLSASVPTVADWRLSTVPRYLTPEEVGRMLQACNRRTATGRRDYAILLLLARLGLHAGKEGEDMTQGQSQGKGSGRHQQPRRGGIRAARDS